MHAVFVLLVGLASTIVLDGLWLAFLARDMFQQLIGHLLVPQVHKRAALVVWIIMVVALYYGVLSHPFVQSMFHAFVAGVLFGLVLYGVYEFTNFAILSQRPRQMIIIDMLW